MHGGIHSDTPGRTNTFYRSDEFDAWLAALKDKLGRARIVQETKIPIESDPIATSQAHQAELLEELGQGVGGL